MLQARFQLNSCKIPNETVPPVSKDAQRKAHRRKESVVAAAEPPVAAADKCTVPERVEAAAVKVASLSTNLNRSRPSSLVYCIRYCNPYGLCVQF